MNQLGNEDLLLTVLAHLPTRTMKAVMLQSYIQEQGPLSEETAVKVRQMLGAKPNDGKNW